MRNIRIKNMATKGLSIFFVVFVCSFSSLAYEIALTRIFSISIWYHFASMIISIAMLGFGASGTLLSLHTPFKTSSNIRIYCMLLGVSISLSYLVSNQIPFDLVRLSWEKTQLLYICLYYLTLSAPFFFAGLVIATAFSSMSGKSGLLYGADLLGAGTGSLGILSVMAVTGPEQAPFILSSIVLCASFVIGEKWLKAASLIFIVLNLSFLLFNPSFMDLRMSPYKGLEVALRFPGAQHLKTYYSPFSRIDTLKSPAVRFAPGLSLGYFDPLPEQTGISIDAGEINAITAAADRKPLAFLGYMPSALPYALGKKDRALILDPKGGLQVLVARYYGAKEIYAIESNPLLLRVIRDEFDRFSGGIYEEHTYPGLGRSWLKARDQNFDIIDISLMNAMPAGSFGISEDYRFTLEAFREYLSHLKPEGLLSINLYLVPPPRTELRLLTTAIAALGELKGSDPEKQVSAVRSWDSVCILIKKSPFTLRDTEEMKKFSRDRRFDLIYYPGIQEAESNRYIRMPSNEYFTAFKNILDTHTRRWFTENYLFDITPVQDDDPFFGNYLRGKNIRGIYRAMGEKWQYFIEEGYILPAVFIQVLFLSLVLMFLPIFRKRQSAKTTPSGKWFLPYFAFLGIGYMFVEIALIQNTILPLENPPYAVATVLASMLMSSGSGSLLSYRVSWLRRPPVLIVISVLIVLYRIVLPAATPLIFSCTIPAKIMAVFLAFIPLGFLMGIPLPTGLKLLGERDHGLIPWAWAINGCLSVLAPVLCVILAMSVGFSAVLLLGASAYAMAFVTLTFFSQPLRS